mgnify:CR=1 FL=1
MRWRKNRAESAMAMAPTSAATATSVAVAPDASRTTVTVTVDHDKPQSKVQVVIRDERADLQQHRDLPDTHSTDREFFQKFYRGKADLKYDLWVRKRFPFWPPVR